MSDDVNNGINSGIALQYLNYIEPYVREIEGQKKEIASLKEQLEQPVKSMPFESWIFSVDFGDAALYEKHCAYMKLAYEARDKEVEHYIRIATQARREK